MCVLWCLSVCLSVYLCSDRWLTWRRGTAGRMALSAQGCIERVTRWAVHVSAFVEHFIMCAKLWVRVGL